MAGVTGESLVSERDWCGWVLEHYGEIRFVTRKEALAFWKEWWAKEEKKNPK